MGNKRKGGPQGGKKNFYHQKKKRGQEPDFCAGLCGILFTVEQARTTEAKREAIDLLQEYEELIYEEHEEEIIAWRKQLEIEQKRKEEEKKQQQEEQQRKQLEHEQRQQQQQQQKQEGDSDNTTETSATGSSDGNNNAAAAAPSESDSAAPSATAASADTNASANNTTKPSAAAAAAASAPARSAPLSIEDQIAQEMEDASKKYRIYNTDMKGIIFVGISYKARQQNPFLTPGNIIKRIMKDLTENQMSKTRYIYRMVPVDNVCKIKDNEEGMNKMIEEVVKKHLSTYPKTVSKKYAVIYKARMNNTLNRMDTVRKVTRNVGFNHTVDVKEPDLAIFVNVMKNLMAVGLADEYTKLKEFNVNETKPLQEKKQPKQQQQQQQKQTNVSKSKGQKEDNNNNSSSSNSGGATATAEGQQQERSDDQDEEGEEETKAPIDAISDDEESDDGDIKLF